MDLSDIHVPLEVSNLREKIPPTDEILYSTFCRVARRETGYGAKMTMYKKEWNTHVIITSAGIAYFAPSYMGPATLTGGKAGSVTAMYVPWYHVKSLWGKGFIIQHDEFRLIRSPEHETEEAFQARAKAFPDKFRPLFRKVSKEAGTAFLGAKIFLGGAGVSYLFLPLFLFLWHFQVEDILIMFNPIEWLNNPISLGLAALTGFLISCCIFGRKAKKRVKTFEAKATPVSTPLSSPTTACPSCGNALPAGSTFCPHCGNTL